MIGQPPRRYAVLHIDALALLLEQAAVAALEPAADVEPGGGDDDAPASIVGPDGSHWPTFCVDADLRALPDTPASRTVCVLLRGGERRAALLADRVVPMDGDGLRFEPLPACMRTSETPVTGIAIQGDLALCVADATRVITLLALESSRAAPAEPAPA